LSVSTALRCALGGLLLGLLLAGLPALSHSAPAVSEVPAEWWTTETARGERQLHLYFFWTRTCPHCRAARPFVEALPADYPWLRLHSHDITQDMAGALQYTRGALQYTRMAEALGESARSVPAFLFCGRMLTGFDSAETTGHYLRQQLDACYRHQIQPATIKSSPQRFRNPPRPSKSRCWNCR